ncbi:MAG: IPT/TIG domain-containing protein [Planctomycetes bacterium]|nr:IPT/TIG domain-containing protein [Planctomycetota bacterium]
MWKLVPVPSPSVLTRLSLALLACTFAKAQTRDAFESNDLPGTGAKVVLPSRLSGLTLHAPVAGLGDVDRFSVPLARGQVLTVRMFDAGDAMFDPLLAVSDPHGRIVATSDGIDGLAFGALSVTAREEGTYEVVVTGATDGELRGAHVETGTYGLDLRVEPVDVYEPNDEPLEASVLPGLPVVLDAVLGTSEMDWFRLAVRTGVRYRVRLEDTGDSPLDPRLGVFDASGSPRLVEASRGLTRFPALAFESSVDGFVLLAVTGWSDTSYLGTHDEAGAYRLQVTEEGADALEPNDDVSTASSLNLPTSATLRLEPQDVDWFAFEVTRGRQYRIRTWDPGGENQAATRIGLFDPAGTTLRRSVVARTARDAFSELVYRATATERIIVAITGADDRDFRGAHVAIGAYGLDVREDVFEPNDEYPLATPLPRDERVGPLVMGPGDTDWFAFDARAGERFLVRLQMVDTEVADLRIGLFGPRSSLLRSVEGGRGGPLPEFVFPVEEPGRYILVVTGGGDTRYFGSHAVEVAYTLECVSLHPFLTPFPTLSLGPLAGGTSLRFLGGNFTTLRDLVVQFGVRTVSPIAILNSGELVVDVPPGDVEGLVDLTLSTVNGSASLPSSYRYIDATSLVLGQTYSGTITSNDTDFVTFESFSGTPVDFDVRGRDATPLLDPRIVLYDPTFQMVTLLPAAQISEGRFRVRRFTLPAGPIGTWYAEIRSESGGVGAYEVRTKRRVPREMKKPTPVPTYQNGVLAFRFASERGSELSAQLAFLPGTALDTVRLYDDRGFEVASAPSAIAIDGDRARVRVRRLFLPRFGEYELRVMGPTAVTAVTSSQFRVKFPRGGRGSLFE